MNSRRRILVTGGAGYVGSHVAKNLARAGYEVITFDNLYRGHDHAVQWGKLLVGDLKDRDAVDRLFRHHRFDAVVHMAALAYVGESVEQPLRYYENNVIGSLNLVEAMVRHDVKHLVFSSTCSIYGIQDTPIDESVRTTPINPYGRSKLSVERLLEHCVHAHGLRVMSLRYFNAAGADPDGELCEQHDPEPHLVPNILAVAVAVLDGTRSGEEMALRVYGGDFDTPDGTAIRDYVHVTDLAAAHRDATQWLWRRERPVYEACNLGTGRGHTVLEVVAVCEHVTGALIPRRIMARRPGDPPVLVADASRARAVLGWRPERSGLETIVGTAWRAIRPKG